MGSPQCSGEECLACRGPALEMGGLLACLLFQGLLEPPGVGFLRSSEKFVLLDFFMNGKMVKVVYEANNK